MKNQNRLFQQAILLALTLVIQARSADPRISSWYIDHSGDYARIYTSDAAKNADLSTTTWSNASQIQNLPAYSGVQSVTSSADWVYVRSSGLGFHVMGPWYLNAAHSQTFPNLPKNQATLFRLPRNPVVATSRTLTGLGAIGCFVDGVAMFDNRDAFSYSNTRSKDANPTAGIGQGDGIWNRDAWSNESITFDPAFAHQENSGTYHYHANPIALRYLLADHVDFNLDTKTYRESTNVVARHSPILGWTFDGFPLYGPYGYSTATNAASEVRRMISGYVPRDGRNGTTNLLTTGRTSLPPWAARANNRQTTLLTSQYGPSVSETYPLGHYLEDNDYLGDLGRSQGVDFDLDEFNGRWCVTPEFPGGTYAYFGAIDASAGPAFPYNIGRQYYGAVNGGKVTTISETVTTNFLGGANATLKLNPPQKTATTVTLSWSAAEGGTYRVDQTTDCVTWTVSADALPAQGNTARITNAAPESVKFYRVARTGLANYDNK